MATTYPHSLQGATQPASPPAIQTLWMLRLIAGALLLVDLLVSLFAVSWDIQWHTAVGRDRTLTFPHVVILSTIAFGGLVALGAVVSETIWLRRHPGLATISQAFAGGFSGATGAYLAGFGMLSAAIAFPLDQYWHTLYGIDVTIWAPFHIMAIASMTIGLFGTTLLLLSGAHLASRHQARRASQVGQIAAMLAWAGLLGALSLLLMPSLGQQGLIDVALFRLNLYPVLFGALFGLGLNVAGRAWSWPGAATSITLMYMVMGLLMALIVPPLMTWLVSVEQQPYRQHAPHVSVVASSWQYAALIAALIFDLGFWLASSRRQMPRNSIALAGIFAAVLLNPLFWVAVYREHVGLLGALISLGLSLVGGLAGLWVGESIGTDMRTSER